MPRLSIRHAQCKRFWRRALSTLLLWLALPAAAHDFWIEPARFRVPVVGERVPLRLLVGNDFKGDGVVYLSQRFERYVVQHENEARLVLGEQGDDPAGEIRPLAPGLHIVGYLSKPFDVGFKTYDEFETYLQQEGLERHKTEAQNRFKARGDIQEVYVRCAKALIAVQHDGGADRALGFPLELIAENNPYREKKLRLRLLYRDKPLAGALVAAFNKDEPLVKFKARTDAEGRVSLTLPRPGVWLVTAVHMIPLPWYARADWESYWASLTFEAPMLK